MVTTKTTHNYQLFLTLIVIIGSSLCSYFATLNNLNLKLAEHETRISVLEKSKQASLPSSAIQLFARVPEEITYKPKQR